MLIELETTSAGTQQLRVEQTKSRMSNWSETNKVQVHSGHVPAPQLNLALKRIKSDAQPTGLKHTCKFLSAPRTDNCQ